jgi:hypothetical protein
MSLTARAKTYLDPAGSWASVRIKDRPNSLVRIRGGLFGDLDHERMGEPSHYACKTLIVLDGPMREA